MYVYRSYTGHITFPRDASVSSDRGEVLAYEMVLALTAFCVKMPVYEYAKASNPQLQNHRPRQRALVKGLYP